MTKELKIQIPEGYEINKDKSTFENIVFKPIEQRYPTSLEAVKRPYYITGDGIIRETAIRTTRPCENDLSSYKRAEAFLALMQLVELRDVYNKIDGFVPDWIEPSIKYVIHVYRGNIVRASNNLTYRTLHFGSTKTMNLFYHNFKDLIEQAKELL